MSLASISNVLACPHCGAALELDERTLRCENRHSFDVAKQGYVNLLGSAQPKNADTAEMVDARDRFLQLGYYSPIAEAVASQTQGARTIVDAGCGTGYYLARALDDQACGVALDISVPALRRAAKAHDRMGAVVADTWKALPLLDNTADALTCIFAPRNLAEFSRVLAPGGRLIIVAPDEQHIKQARLEFGLLDVEEGKHDKLLTDTAELFEVVSDELVRAPLDLSAEEAGLLVGMGPNAFHGHNQTTAINTQLSVHVTTLRAR